MTVVEQLLKMKISFGVFARRQSFRFQMKYRKGYTWVYNKTYGETFNKTWITFNSM